MSGGIDYVRDGERVAVYFDSTSPDLPVRMRGGAIRFYRWGAIGAVFQPRQSRRLRREVSGDVLRRSVGH